MSEDPYAALRVHFADRVGITVNSGRGSQGIKIGKKMTVMFSKGELLLKLTPARVQALITAGEGEPFVLSNGKLMADRVVIPVRRTDLWIALAEEALAP
jgi:hypothetical protein